MKLIIVEIYLNCFKNKRCGINLCPIYVHIQTHKVYPHKCSHVYNFKNKYKFNQKPWYGLHTVWF